MIDKLSLQSGELVNPALVLEKLKGITCNHKLCPESKYHRRTEAFYCLGPGGKHHVLFSLSTEPKLGNRPTKVDLNPTKFQSYADMVSTLSKVMNLDLAEITRIDHTVDLEFPIKDLWSSLLLSRKKLREVWSGSEIESFYYGKYPERLVVYDKAKQLGVQGTLTRLELRQQAYKLPIQKFNQFPELINLKPFAGIKFLKPKSSAPSLRMREKALYLEKCIEFTGLQGAFKELNKHSNFKRDFKGCLERNESIPDLNQKYQETITQFLRGA